MLKRAMFWTAVVAVTLALLAVVGLAGYELLPTASPHATPAAPSAAGAPVDVHSLWALLAAQTGLPIWLIVVAFIGVAAGLVGMMLYLFPTGRKRYFAVIFGSLVAIAVFVLYKHDLLDEGTRSVFYLLAPAAFIALVIVEDAWLATAFALFTFTLLGLSTVGWHVSDLTNHVHFEGGPTIQQVSVPANRSAPATSGWVIGQPQTLTYGPSLTVVNRPPYQLRGKVLQGCVGWYDVEGRRLAHSCEGDMPSVDGITSIRADSAAVVKFNHCQNFTPGHFLDVCG